MDEEIKVNINYVVDLVESANEHFYKWCTIGDMTEGQFNIVLAVTSYLIHHLDRMAEEIYETDTDYTE